MRTKLSVLIPALFVLLLPESAAQAQSFGPAEWIRLGWSSREGWRIIPLDVAVGPGEDIFVTGRHPGEEIAQFEVSESDIRRRDTPPAENNYGFLARYDGGTGDLVFVQPGSALSTGNSFYPLTSAYSTGYSLAVVDEQVFHGEGRDFNLPYGYSYRTGSALITVRDLQGSVLRRTRPRERFVDWWSIFIQGTGFDEHGNIYMAGTYMDTLFFAPDLVLAPSLRVHHASWDVFMSSYARDGTVRWAQQINDSGSGHLWVSRNPRGKMAFDVDAEGNMVLGAKAYGRPPEGYSAAEDGSVVAHYDSDGALQRIQTLADLGISYEPTFQELWDAGGLIRAFSWDYVPSLQIIRRDRRGNLYAMWVKSPVRDRRNSLTVSDTTFYGWDERPVYVLTKFDTQGTLQWARQLEQDWWLSPVDIELTAEGHVYVYGYFRGKYLLLEGIEYPRDEPRYKGSHGFVAHYDENGHLVRVLHAAGSGSHEIHALTTTDAGDVYIAGSFSRDMTLGADTLMARGAENMFVARYSAMSLSSEPSAEVPGEVVAVSNYPNPFVDGTTISYSVPTAGKVKLAIYDLLGRQVAMVVDARQSAGRHSARLDASAWPSGIYVYRLEAGEQSVTGSLVHH